MILGFKKAYPSQSYCQLKLYFVNWAGTFYAQQKYSLGKPVLKTSSFNKTLCWCLSTQPRSQAGFVIISGFKNVQSYCYFYQVDRSLLRI